MFLPVTYGGGIDDRRAEPCILSLPYLIERASSSNALAIVCPVLCGALDVPYSLKLLDGGVSYCAVNRYVEHWALGGSV